MSGTDEPSEGRTPYGNLMVPLVVVPAIIVMVLVLVFVLFAGIVGEEASPKDNLQTMLVGGKNARQQAAFNLVRQTLEAWEAEAAGREPEWELDERFLPDLASAWERTREDEVASRLVLALLMAGQGDRAGVTHLLELLELGEDADPDAGFRFKVAGALALLAEQMGQEDSRRVSRALIGLLDARDEGLRGAAVVALQRFPGPRTVAALQGMLQSSSLVLRGNAALALAELGDDSGREVLLELLEREPYAAERRADGQKWSQERLVSRSRIRALDTLVELGEAPGSEVLERLADDPDLEFRGRVRGLLAGGG